MDNGTPAPAASAWFSEFLLIQLGEWQNDQFRICMDLGFQPVAKWIYLKGSPRLTAYDCFIIISYSSYCFGPFKRYIISRSVTSETRRRSRQRPTSALRISCECWKQLSSQGNISYISEDDMIKLNLFYMWYQMFQCQYWAIFFAIPKKWGSAEKDVIKFERAQIKKRYWVQRCWHRDLYEICAGMWFRSRLLVSPFSITQFVASWRISFNGGKMKVEWGCW